VFTVGAEVYFTAGATKAITTGPVQVIFIVFGQAVFALNELIISHFRNKDKIKKQMLFTH